MRLNAVRANYAVKTGITEKGEKMKHKDFEYFVQNEHGKQYCGTNDGCVEDYEDWLTDLCADDWFELGNKYAKEVSGWVSVKERLPKINTTVQRSCDEN